MKEIINGIMARLAVSASDLDALKNLPDYNDNGSSVGAGNLRTILYWVLSVGGLLAVVMIVYGGFKYMRAEGQPDKIKTASSIIAYAVIGLGVVLLASAIVSFIFAATEEATS